MPATIVTCSVCVCQCGNTWKPSGNRRRMVNMPGCVGSPSRTVILAPLGKEGGPSFHSISVAGKRAIGFLVWPAAAVEIVNRSRLRTQRGLIGVVSSRARSEERRVGKECRYGESAQELTIKVRRRSEVLKASVKERAGGRE